jgi:hypothetical protein
MDTRQNLNVAGRTNTGYTIYLFRKADLVKLTEDARWRRTTNTQAAIQSNIDRGRDRFNDAVNVLVPVVEARKVAVSYAPFDYRDYQSGPSLNPSSFEMEQTVAKILGGTVITDRQQQREDKDVAIGKVSVSVKLQRAAARTGNFSFEMKRFVPNNPNDSFPGNFVLCKADLVAIVVPA